MLNESFTSVVLAMHEMRNLGFSIFKIVYILPSFLFVVSLSLSQQDETDKIKFWFYPNASNISFRHEFKIEDPSTITESTFNKDTTAKLVIHGAGASCTEAPFPLFVLEGYLTEKSMKNADYNVICVDWGPLSSPSIRNRMSIREQTSRNTLFAGERITLLLNTMKENGLISNYSSIHIISHSLGAHASGIVGLKIYQSTIYTEKIGRISGIDPAGVYYRDKPLNLDEQLDLSDADYVDVTHTNMKFIGLEGKYGHSDFYPNGGEHQTECFRRGFGIALLEGACSHLIGAEYWKTSILNKSITACKAESYDEFKRNPQCADNLIIWGDSAPTNSFGKYYFDI